MPKYENSPWADVVEDIIYNAIEKSDFGMPTYNDEVELRNKIFNYLDDVELVGHKTVESFKETNAQTYERVVDKSREDALKFIARKAAEEAERYVATLPTHAGRFDIDAQQEWVDGNYEAIANVEGTGKVKCKAAKTLKKIDPAVKNIIGNLQPVVYITSDGYVEYYLEGSKKYMDKLLNAEDVIDLYGATVNEEKHSEEVQEKIIEAVRVLESFGRNIVENLLHQVQVDRKYLWSNKFTEGYNEIFGASGALKSFVLMSLAFCVSHGIEFAGEPTAHGRVVYIAAEADQEAGIRFRAIADHYGVELDPSMLKLMTQDRIDLDLTDPKSVKMLEERFKRYDGKSEWLVLDTLVSVAPDLDPIKNTGWGRIFANIQTLKPYFNTISWVVHTPQNTPGKAEGNSRRFNGLDSQIGIVKSGKNATKTELRCGKNKGGKAWSSTTIFFETYDLNDDESTLVPKLDNAPDEVAPKEEKVKLHNDDDTKVYNVFKQYGDYKKAVEKVYSPNGEKTVRQLTTLRANIKRRNPGYFVEED